MIMRDNSCRFKIRRELSGAIYEWAKYKTTQRKLNCEFGTTFESMNFER